MVVILGVLQFGKSRRERNFYNVIIGFLSFIDRIKVVRFDLSYLGNE